MVTKARTVRLSDEAVALGFKKYGGKTLSDMVRNAIKAKPPEPKVVETRPVFGGKRVAELEKRVAELNLKLKDATDMSVSVGTKLNLAENRLVSVRSMLAARTAEVKTLKSSVLQMKTTALQAVLQHENTTAELKKVFSVKTSALQAEIAVLQRENRAEITRKDNEILTLKDTIKRLTPNPEITHKPERKTHKMDCMEDARMMGTVLPRAAVVPKKPNSCFWGENAVVCPNNCGDFLNLSKITGYFRCPTCKKRFRPDEIS